MRWYLDTSVAAHAILASDVRARTWMDEVAASGEMILSSSLLQLEITRVLRREHLDPALALPLIDRVALISINDGVLRAAAAIQPHIRALDAIHLASGMLLGSHVTFVTHDAQMASAAGDLGYRVFDPLAHR